MNNQEPELVLVEIKPEETNAEKMKRLLSKIVIIDDLCRKKKKLAVNQ